MSKVADSIRRGLEEAIAYAKARASRRRGMRLGFVHAEAYAVHELPRRVAKQLDKGLDAILDKPKHPRRA